MLGKKHLGATVYFEKEFSFETPVLRSMTETDFKTTLRKFVPEPALDYSFELWHRYGFMLKIKNKRASKLGDYRFSPQTCQHVITVNNDLNPFSFLITYIHEVAHLLTFSEFKRNVRPHGEEWKKNFQKLMLPVLTNEVFPDQVLRRLAVHLKNPKASSCNDHQLMKALQQYDERKRGINLSEISTGELFKFRERIFKKEDLRRTRYVCCEQTTKTKYLISGMAEVEPLAKPG